MSDPIDEALPDVLGALVVHSRTSMPNVTSLTGQRISTRVRTKSTDDPNGWSMPDYAIVFNLVGGPVIPALSDVKQQMARVDVHCYGPDERTARVLWRTFHPYLCPGDAVGHAFRAANTQVINVLQASGEMPYPEPGTGWPRDTVSYLVQYSEIPTP